MRRCLLLVAVLFAAVHVAAAQESLLGLPAPSDPQKPGTVFLHGGGAITSDAWSAFLALAGGKNARIILVPCAGFRRASYASDAAYRAAVSNRYGSWVSLARKGEIASCDFLYTDDPRDAENEKFIEPLTKATGVWFTGGSQDRLNYRFVNFPQPTKFQAALRGVLVRGGVVGGTSAGMAALPEVMTLRQDRDPASAQAEVVAAHGLGLFNQAIVEQHFDGRAGRLERFTGLLRDNARLDQLAGRPGAGTSMMGIAVEEGTALAVRGDRMKVFGRSAVHVFIKATKGRSITWHELASGETAQFRRDERGLSQLVREELLVQGR